MQGLKHETTSRRSRKKRNCEYCRKKKRIEPTAALLNHTDVQNGKMKEGNAINSRVYYSLYDRMLSATHLYEAFKRVKASKGIGGIDRQNIGNFETNIGKNIRKLLEELRDKTYTPMPLKRGTIPKENGKVREIGIPTVRDRVVQQALLMILQPIYEEDFHPSSYGYRPGRSAHQAISKATMFIRNYELNHVVDMDLSRCFDTLAHELIIKFMRKRVTDGSILKLVKKFLESGVMSGNVIHEVTEGSPQGGVISPLLANIYLNEFDHFMMQRNYRIVRYADDILILCESQRSAKHALEVATSYLEKDLILVVNKEKTHITDSVRGVKFLGVVIYSTYTAIKEKNIEAFKEKVRFLTKRNQGMNLEMVIKRLNPVLRGFANYFRIANCKRLLQDMMSWIRRRLRALQLKLWKKPGRLHRRLRHLGYKGIHPKIKMNSWRNSASWQASYAMPNYWFVSLGLVDMSRVKTGLIVPA